MFKKLLAIFLTLTICIGLGIGSTISYADLDGLTDEENYSQQEQNVLDDSGNIIDAIQDSAGVKKESLDKAKVTTSPLTDAIGTLVGIVIMLADAGVVLITGFDLLYMGVPITRGFLTSKYQLVSDEALSLVGSNGQAGGMNNGMSGGMHGGMMNGGMSGGMMNGGMSGGMAGGMSGNTGNQGQGGSLIITYFKRRTVFIVVFAVATVILTSSILTGVGLNVAGLLVKIINKLSGAMSGVNV